MPSIGGPELIIILVVVLIIFGPSRLPQLGESIGKTMRSLRQGMDGKSDEEPKPKAKAKAKPKAEETVVAADPADEAPQADAPAEDATESQAE